MPSPLKSPTATEEGERQRRSCGRFEANGDACHWRRYCQRERLGRGPATVVESGYRHRIGPAGCASVTRTTPVVGSPASVPLKSVEVETLMLVVLVGGASGVTVVSVLSARDVSE